MPTNVSKNLLNLSHYYKDRRNPDILDCIANLSSDEVFTPPELADKVLDLLPEDVWSNPNLKWLDPACKTGVFLRQIAIRLMVGLKDAIPDEAERIFQTGLLRQREKRGSEQQGRERICECHRGHQQHAVTLRKILLHHLGHRLRGR